MDDALHDFIPPAAYDQVIALLSHDNLVVKIKQERKTRHVCHIPYATPASPLTDDGERGNSPNLVVDTIYSPAHPCYQHTHTLPTLVMNR